MRVAWFGTGFCVAFALLGACSGSDEGSGGDGAAGEAGEGSGDGGRAGDAGGAAEGGASGGEQAGGAGAGGVDGEPVALPPGSREFDGIVNLVDAAAAAELEATLTTQESMPVFLRQGFAASMNLFLEHYPEEYDFVVFVTDHALPASNVAGLFEAVNRPAQPGTGNDIVVAPGGYRTNGSVKGAIGIPYTTVIYPPLAHEALHYWANYLDARFGFGAALGVHHGAHWGFSSVNGQLGGFDPATLRCQTPAGGMPPACTGAGGGRVRYVVGEFGAFANAFRGIPYSALELYLMGLVPAAEVEPSFQLLLDAELVAGAANPTARTVVVEASGIESVSLADIRGRHGSVPLLAASARAFRAAFVVVSAEPAPDDVLERVAEWAAGFGNRTAVPGWPSFEEHTGARATMDTMLGPRRLDSDPPPPVRERFVCDPLAQDCGSVDLGCYVFPPAYCARSGGVGEDELCDALNACAPGLDCVAPASAPTAYVCKPYCDPSSAASPTACATLCPGSFFTIESTAGEVFGAICLPS